jgi:prevent-host-death family protein
LSTFPCHEPHDMDTVTATELHDRTAELTEQAMRDPERPIFVEKHGKAAVVLVDARYFEGLLETLDLLSDPEAMKQLRRGLADERAGRLMSHQKLVKELGLDGKTNRSGRVDTKRRRRPARNR